MQQTGRRQRQPSSFEGVTKVSNDLSMRVAELNPILQYSLEKWEELDGLTTVTRSTETLVAIERGVHWLAMREAVSLTWRTFTILMTAALEYYLEDDSSIRTLATSDLIATFSHHFKVSKVTLDEYLGIIDDLRFYTRTTDLEPLNELVTWLQKNGSAMLEDLNLFSDLALRVCERNSGGTARVSSFREEDDPGHEDDEIHREVRGGNKPDLEVRLSSGLSNPRLFRESKNNDEATSTTTTSPLTERPRMQPHREGLYRSRTTQNRVPSRRTDQVSRVNDRRSDRTTNAIGVLGPNRNKDLCRNWNMGRCRTEECHRLHRCMICRDPRHTQMACPLALE